MLSFVEMKKLNNHKPFCLSRNSVVETPVKLGDSTWATMIAAAKNLANNLSALGELFWVALEKHGYLIVPVPRIL